MSCEVIVTQSDPNKKKEYILQMDFEFVENSNEWYGRRKDIKKQMLKMMSKDIDMYLNKLNLEIKKETKINKRNKIWKKL